MKKLLKIIGVVVIVLIAAIVLTPVLFKGKLETVAKEQINNSVNAKVDFSAFKLSLIKGFPDLSVELEGLTVVGLEPFENDTLISFNSFVVEVNLLSAIKMENIEVKAIVLDHPVIHAKVTKEGIANWDIAKETEEEVEEEVDTTASEPTEIKVGLKKFSIVDADIYYEDKMSDMSSSIEGFNFNLKGDLSETFTSILLEITAELIDFEMEGVSYLNNAELSSRFEVDADLENGVYTLKQNEIGLNALVLGMDGKINIPEEGDMGFDLTFNTKKTDFKSLLSMVPGVFLEGFEDIETNGTLALDGYVKGFMGETTMPSAGLNLVVGDAYFKYPDLPKSVEDINIDVDVFYNGENEDLTTVDVNNFHLALAGNPVDIYLKLRTPMSDPQVETKITGNINLASLADVIPLEDTKITGAISSDIFLKGKMSMIEEEKYEEFIANGSLGIENFLYDSPDLPVATTISKALLEFSPKVVNLAQLDIKMGDSDMSFTGKMENFIPYALSDGVLKGEFVFSSNYIDVNPFLSEEEVEEVQEVIEEEEEIEVAEIPANIDFTLATSINKVLYEEMVVENIKGTIYVKESIAKLEKLRMNLLNGSMEMTAVYNTQDAKKPVVNYKMSMKSIDIPSAFNAFNTVRELAPAAEYAKGNLSLDLDFNSLLDKSMMPVLSSISGDGSFKSKSIQIVNSPTLMNLSEKLNTKTFNDIAFKDVFAMFEIEDGTVRLKEPIETQFGSSNLTLSGEQSLDKKMNYNLDLEMPKALLGGQANTAIAGLTNKAKTNGLNIPESDKLFVNAIVTGMVDNPDIKLNLKENASATVDVVKTEIIEKKEEIVDDTKEKANAEAQRIIDDAEKRAQKIKDLAKQEADLIRSNADKAYNKSINEVKNQPKIVRTPAEKAAAKIRDEAYAKATRLEKEAEVNANKVISEARTKANKLTQ